MMSKKIANFDTFDCCWLLLLLLLQSTEFRRLLAIEDIVHKKDHHRDPWALRMVYNVHWDKSESFMAVQRVPVTASAGGQTRLGHTVPVVFEDAQIAYLYGVGGPNMRMNFGTDAEGAAYCEIGIVPDSVFEKFEQFSKESAEIPPSCWFEPEKMYADEQPVERRRQTAFCMPKLEAIRWQFANGTFNKPSKEPQCLYDFYHEASVTYEYNLFRYCAKGYFYNGKDHDDKRKTLGREDWLLFLAEGNVTCSISGNVEADRGLLSRGYTLELVHYSNFERDRFIPGLELCPDLNATLTSYHDNDRSGEFFFGAVIGAGQLDGHFTWSYRKETKRFWDVETMQHEYAGMNLGKRACYLHYNKMLRRTRGGEGVEGRYNLELRVTHYCSHRGMRETLSFDVSIGPKQVGGDRKQIYMVPEGVYEDMDISIDLSAGRLKRSTGQVLCAREKSSTTKESACEQPQQRPEDKQLKKLGERCGQPKLYTKPNGWFGNAKAGNLNTASLAYASNCVAGARCLSKGCLKDNTDECHIQVTTTHKTCADLDSTTDYTLCVRSGAREKAEILCGPCVCRPTSRVNADGKCQQGQEDQECDDDKFCANGVCKKWRMKEAGEPCRFHVECFPGFRCKPTSKEGHKWGTDFGQCDFLGRKPTAQSESDAEYIDLSA